MRKLIAVAALATITFCMSGIASAGEITGGPNPKPTPAGEVAQSECAFSGQEDGNTRIFVPGEGFIIVHDTPTGPGYVQTPHQENGAGVIHDPGIAGLFCRGN
jgi:hypothetical protein